jgi:hypothetical protein
LKKFFQDEGIGIMEFAENGNLNDFIKNCNEPVGLVSLNMLLAQY